MQAVQIWILLGVVSVLIVVVRFLVGWIIKRNEKNYEKVTQKIDELIVSMNNLSVAIAADKEIVKGVICNQNKFEGELKEVTNRVRIVENRQLGCKNFVPKITDHENEGI